MPQPPPNTGPAGGRPVPPPTGPGANFDARLDALRKRLKGAGPKREDAIRKRIQNVRARQYLQGQKHAPDPTLPFDAQYDSTVAGLNRDRDVAAGQAAYQQQRAQSAYGFDNPAANPYSRAAMLQRSFNENNAQTVNSMAARGQLYAGATQSQMDTNVRDFGQAWDTARTDYQDQLRGITDDLTGAADEYTAGLAKAEADRLARALEIDVDPAEAPATPDYVKKFLHWQKQQKKDKNKGNKGNGGKK